MDYKTGSNPASALCRWNDSVPLVGIGAIQNSFLGDAQAAEKLWESNVPVLVACRPPDQFDRLRE
jgi:hypothetical protein